MKVQTPTSISRTSHRKVEHPDADLDPDPDPDPLCVLLQMLQRVCRLRFSGEQAGSRARCLQTRLEGLQRARVGPR